eukprot:TRINITY_DN49099_c0_g1_i1.p1 TRINITY_DN49099_c0_g1~~TRINITY_DN49099_c0_g1_i1.p1  ORF type:complete len:373 (+),score=80.64 TRINITY_DN49099_c0_g1_i1:101-1219(+)
MDRGKTASLIAEFDCIENALASLADARRNLKKMDKLILDLSYDVPLRESFLHEMKKEKDNLWKRIRRNENPRLFHFFVCNRKEKVVRLKEEFEQKHVTEQSKLETLAVDVNHLAILQAERRKLQGKLALTAKHEWARERLFEQIVDGQPPTEELKQLRVDIEQLRVSLTSEAALVDVVSSSIQMMQQGWSQLQQSEGLYLQALVVTESAERVAKAEIKEEAREKQLECERDSLISSAQKAAVRALQSIRMSVETFPADARPRCPQLFESFNNANLCQCHGMIFTCCGLKSGASSTTSTVERVQGCIRVVRQDIDTTSQLLALFDDVHLVMKARVRQLESEAQRLDQEIIVERERMFKALRVSSGEAFDSKAP